MNIHRVPKVLCVSVRSLKKVGEAGKKETCAGGHCQVRQGTRHDTWMTIIGHLCVQP